VKRVFVRAIGAYATVALLTVAMVSLRIGVLEPQLRHEHAAGMVQARDLLATSSAIAAEVSPGEQCALRDLRLVMSIAAHGEAEDVPADALREAFFTMTKARAACAAGRISEAFAIYDSIAIVPVARAASK